MLKKTFLLIFALIAHIAFAQNIVYDQTNQNGVRTVVCSGMNIGVSNNMDTYIALAGFKYKSTVLYSIAVSIGSQHKTDIPQNSKMIITLANGKVIECPSVVGGTSVLESIDVQMSDVYQTYRRFAYYNIKEKDIKKIQKSSIIQIDIQLFPSNYSAAFKDNQLGNVITADYGIIKDTLQ